MSESGTPTEGASRRILNSITAGLGTTLVVSVLGAGSIRLMTTHFGAHDFGIFVLIQAFVSLAWNFSDLGLSEVLQRDIARGDRDERWLLSRALGLRVTLGVIVIPIAAAIGILVYAHRSDTLKIGLLILLCSVPFSMAQAVAAAHFTARLRNTILVIGSFIQQSVFVGLVFLAVVLNKSILYCVGAALVGAVISSAFVVVASRREVDFHPTYDRQVWFSMLRTSSPIGLAYVLGSLYVKADTIILSFLSNVKQIGYYGVSYAIISVFLVIPPILSRTFIPSLVNATADSAEEAADRSLAFFAIGGTLSATGVMVCGPTVVRIFAGTNFAPAILPLRILGLGLVFTFMSSGLTNICLGRGFTNKLFQVSVISLVLNVALNIAAIPSLGIKGAAAATLVCEAISMLFMMRIISTHLKVKPKVFQALARPFAAGVVTSLVLAPVYLTHDLNNGIGLSLMPAVCVVYFGTLAALRGVPVEVSTALRSVRRSA